MGSHLRVMSANLWNGAADPDALVRQIVDLKVDVLAVQEVSPEQADAIRSVLPHGEIEPARDYCGMGIALRGPARLARVAMRYRDARVVHLDPIAWPQIDRALEIINVHVAAPHAPPLVGTQWNRRDQVRRLVDHLIDQKQGEERAGEQSNERGSRLVVGDLNATPVWPAYRRIADHMIDAAIVVAQRRGRDLQATWGPWPAAPRVLRIDHGFVSGIEVEEFQVVPVAGSDHSGIVIDLANVSGCLPAAPTRLGGGQG